MCLDEREEIRAGIERGDSGAEIARRLGRHPTTVTREIRRNKGRQLYRAIRAQRRCNRKRRRPKTPKLLANPQLARVVEKGLQQGYSPPAIAALLREAGGARVVHETIYQALYSPVFRGITLLPQRCLRTRRRRRRRHDRRRHGAIPRLAKGYRLISERPAEALDRGQPGHWEDDMILGTRASGSAIATLVERSSRLVLLAPLPPTPGAWDLHDALVEVFAPVPAHMRRSLTWDQGAEMHRWRELEEQLELPVFFCEARSPWQRGSNENTNRQLRFWFPKGTDITAHPRAFFDRVAFILNNQPRRLLRWSTAQERYRQLSML
jgi:IS30 family transposase